MKKSNNIYLASSWRNKHQPWILTRLRAEGFEVYDFRNPGETGFHWSDIHPDWKEWSTVEMVAGFNHPLAQQGFDSDMDALQACDTCVMLMPAGRSAALELGWAVGAGKRSAVLVMEEQEPELMLKMADYVTDDIGDLVNWLKSSWVK